MHKTTAAKGCFLALMTLWLVQTQVMSGGCKKADPPETTQQTEGALPAEHVTAAETVDNTPIPNAPPEPKQANQVSTMETVTNTDKSEKLDLRILYVGLPGTDRQKDFVAFLGRHFRQVDTADYHAFKEQQTKGCDVAIFDNDGLEWAPLDITVSGQYSRATVSLGVPGAFWVRSVSRRMGYM
jgi:hypothetical protein